MVLTHNAPPNAYHSLIRASLPPPLQPAAAAEGTDRLLHERQAAYQAQESSVRGRQLRSGGAQARADGESRVGVERFG